MSLDLYLIEDVKCPHCGGTVDGTELYWRNITHNLGGMAQALGVYEILWHPGDHLHAADLVAPLERAVQLLDENPAEYKQYEAPNGWGTISGFYRFLTDVLRAAKDNPSARVKAWI